MEHLLDAVILKYTGLVTVTQEIFFYKLFCFLMTLKLKTSYDYQ